MKLNKAKRFETTRWSMIITAKGGRSPKSRQALEQLCQIYWFPVYSYICRRGNRIEQAQDLTQEFFTRLLEKQFLRKAEQERGRFRSFLLRSVENFLADEWDKRKALKRGGGVQHLTLDFAAAEGLMAEAASDQLTPEKLFDLHWAKTILARALARLEAEYIEEGKGTIFGALRPSLGGAPSSPPYKDLAHNLGMKEGAVKVAAHRMRKRYGTALEAEILETISDPAELKRELKDLMAALTV